MNKSPEKQLPATEISYRPEIDGLRAVAILPVIIFHLGAHWLPGGFVGVDVFFVISGYLITAILLKEHSLRTFTFKKFWLRRIRRILPAMLLVLFASLLAGFFILFDDSWTSLGRQSISTLTLTANLMMHRLTLDYWAPAANTLPLLHMWSLSIEEQFYLFYPLLLAACFKWFPKKLIACLAAILLISLIACIVTTFRAPSAAFYYLPTRAWELAAGGLLSALAFRRQSNADVSKDKTKNSPVLHPWLATLGLGLIAGSWFALSSAGFPGYKALMPVIGTMLVIQYAGCRHCLTTWLLSNPAVCFIGRISYSLYLWHWPVIVFAHAAQSRWENVLFWPFIALIPILALAAFYLVELPGRRLKNPLPWVIPGTAVVLGLSFCLTHFRRGYDVTKFAPTVWMGRAYSSAPRWSPQDPILASQWDGITAPARESRYSNAFNLGGINKSYGGKTVDVLVLGNSHALMWAPVIDEICQRLHLTVVFYLAEAVDPFPYIPPEKKPQGAFTPEEMAVFDSNRVNMVKQLHARLIIISCRWAVFDPDQRLEQFLRLVADNGSSQLLFIEDPPEISLGGANVRQFFSKTSSISLRSQPENLAAQDKADSVLQSLTNLHKMTHVVQVSALYLTNGSRIKVREGNHLFYRDGDHLSLDGARLAEKRIEHSINQIITRSPSIPER